MNSLRRAWLMMGVHGRIALGAAVLVAAVLVYQARHIATAATTPAAQGTQAAGADRQRGLQYAAAVDSMVRHIDGRSLFFIPSAPPPPPPPPPPKVEEKDPPPPPPPSRYGGPGIIAMLNDSVWLEDGQRLREGESNGTVRLVRLDAPWGARIEWKGVEFDVGLFERDKVVMPAPAEQSPKSGDPPASRISATDSPAGEQAQEAKQE